MDLSIASRAGVRLSRSDLLRAPLMCLCARCDDRPGRRNVFRYSTSQLLRLREKDCVGVPRKTKRFLFVHKLLQVCNRQHEQRPQAIPVRITKGKQVTVPYQRKRQRFLKKIEPASSGRRPIKRRIPSIMLSNVRSMTNKMDEAHSLVQSGKPDIAVFVESWLDEQTPDTAIDIPGYVVFREDRNSFGGGIMCYVNDLYNAQVLDSPTSCLSKCDTEMLTLFVCELRLLVICIYHPVWNNISKHDIAISSIIDVIDSVLSSDQFPQDSKVILCGDFNDLHKFSNKISHLTGLMSHVDAPTRLDKSLDLIFSNYVTSIKADILPPLGRSDHAVVFWKADDNLNTFSKAKVRRYSKANVARFGDILMSTDWLEMVKSEFTLDDSASTFLHTLKYLFDSCFPVRTVRIRKSDPEWMSNTLRILMNDRDAAWHKGNMSKYHRLRDEVSREIQRAKSKFLRDAASTQDARTLWKSIKKIGKFGESKSSSLFSAHEFSDYFASIYEVSPNFNALNYVGSFDYDCLPSLELNVSVNEVSELLQKMKNKGPGSDGVPSWVFKDFCFFLAPALTYIFNRSFHEKRVPSCFKDALITPVPKIARPSSPAHFRPISRLCVVSKILEKLVVRHWFLPYIKNLDPSQFAYIPRQGSGTISALTLLYDDIVRYLDSKSGGVRLLSVDFSKAFDKLPFQTILKSCTSAGLPIQAINWLSSYLCDRRQCVSLHDSRSSWYSLPSGVPQGSIIGPLLFSITLASLHPIRSNSKMIKYADDISLVHFVRNASDDSLQDEFDNIKSWSDLAGLQLNFSKCSITNFITSKSLVCPPVFSSDVNVLPTVNEVKILGVTFSSNLLWNSHICNQVKKASKRIFIIRNLKRAGCDKKVLFNVYKALLRSVLLYCYPCFCNAPQYLHNLLLKVERRVLRIVSQDDDSQHPSVICEADKFCKLLFSKVEVMYDHPLRALFNTRNPTPRNNCTLRRPRTKTKRFSDSFIKYCPS